MKKFAQFYKGIKTGGRRGIWTPEIDPQVTLNRAARRKVERSRRKAEQKKK